MDGGVRAADLVGGKISLNVAADDSEAGVGSQASGAHTLHEAHKMAVPLRMPQAVHSSALAGQASFSTELSDCFVSMLRI